MAHFAQRRSVLKYKPHLAALAAGVGLMAFASPAMALPGDAAIDSSSPFRLNPYTLEPGCTTRAHTDSHIDIAALVDGDLREELHVTVGHDSPVSVDQVLVPGKGGGYAVYDNFPTAVSDEDDDIDPDITAFDLFGPEGTSFIANDDVIVCVSDHNDDYQNEPYVQEDHGLVAAKNRPVIEPKISCLGASALEPLNTYKVGFGYGATGYDMDDRAVQLLGIRDPNAVDFNGDGTPDAVWIKTREDGYYDARRVNDMDSFGEEFGHNNIDDLGQTELFLLKGDDTAWTLSNNNYPDTLSNLITFTTQGDLPLTWTVRASLAMSGTKHSVTVDDEFVRDWEADWQAYYDGAGPKPTLRLCPGTNSPARDGVNPASPAAPAAPAAPAQTNTITREITRVETVAGATTVKQGTAKAAKKSAKKAKRSCMKKAKAKKSKKAKKRAMKRCSRIK
jgi:hypothetical protein